MSALRCALRSRGLLAAVPSASSGGAPAPLARAALGVRCVSFNTQERLADESVLEHLVDPISKYPLRYDAARGRLVCDEINVEYPIWHGVPVLVPTEGRIVSSSSEDQQ